VDRTGRRLNGIDEIAKSRKAGDEVCVLDDTKAHEKMAQEAAFRFFCDMFDFCLQFFRRLRKISRVILHVQNGSHLKVF